MNIEEKCGVLGQRLKAARLEKNLSQTELSSLSGISRGKIIAAEQGQGTMETMLSILAVLKSDNDVDALLSEINSSSTVSLERYKKFRERASSNRRHLMYVDEPKD